MAINCGSYVSKTVTWFIMPSIHNIILLLMHASFSFLSLLTLKSKYILCNTNRFCIARTESAFLLGFSIKVSRQHVTCLTLYLTVKCGSARHSRTRISSSVFWICVGVNSQERNYCLPVVDAYEVKVYTH